MDEIVGEASVDNPLKGEGGGADEADPPRVLCEVYRELVVASSLLTSADGRPSGLYRFGQAAWLLGLPARLIIGAAERAKAAGHPGDYHPNILFWGAAWAWGICSLFLFAPLSGMCNCTAKLEALGGGTVSIRTADAQSLRMWRMVLSSMAAITICMGVGMLVVYVYMILFMWEEDKMQGQGYWRGDAVVALGFVQRFRSSFLISPIFTYGLLFVLSMKTASTLGRHAIAEVAVAAQTTSPQDESSWRERVTIPALALPEVLERISQGWARGLEGVAVFCWGIGLGQFMAGVNSAYTDGRDQVTGSAPGSQQIGSLMGSLCFSLFPLALCWELAQTSSYCDRLMDTLNDVRAREIAHHADHESATRMDAALTRVETYLTKLNRGQGLGFKMFGKVIDRKTLLTFFVAMGSGLSTIAVTIIAFGQVEDASTDTVLCALTPTEASTIRALLSNATCAYNASIADIMAGLHE